MKSFTLEVCVLAACTSRISNPISHKNSSSGGISPFFPNIFYQNKFLGEFSSSLSQWYGETGSKPYFLLTSVSLLHYPIGTINYHTQSFCPLSPYLYLSKILLLYCYPYALPFFIAHNIAPLTHKKSPCKEFVFATLSLPCEGLGPPPFFGYSSRCLKSNIACNP